jgi:hypothetical protein
VGHSEDSRIMEITRSGMICKRRSVMSIEFGMPTLIELTGLEENAKLCNSLGLKFIELKFTTVSSGKYEEKQNISRYIKGIQSLLHNPPR